MASLGELSTLSDDACLLLSPRALFILPTDVCPLLPNTEDLGILSNDSLYKADVFSSYYKTTPFFMTSLGELSTL